MAPLEKLLTKKRTNSPRLPKSRSGIYVRSINQYLFNIMTNMEWRRWFFSEILSWSEAYVRRCREVAGTSATLTYTSCSTVGRCPSDRGRRPSVNDLLTPATAHTHTHVPPPLHPTMTSRFTWHGRSEVDGRCADRILDVDDDDCDSQ